MNSQMQPKVDANGNVQSPLSVPQTPFCGNLRSKKYFMLDVIPTEAEQYLDDSHHCWCFHTQQALGPDGYSVEPQHCVAGRGCYRSALAVE